METDVIGSTTCVRIHKTRMLTWVQSLFLSDTGQGPLQGFLSPTKMCVSSLQVTHLPPVWDLLLSLAQTPDRRDHRLLVYLPKDSGKANVG